MKLLRQLTGPLASPDYRDFLASLASISAGYSSIYDSRTYLLTQDENYGTGSAPCEGVEISAPIDGSVYGDLLRELLVRPITNSKPFISEPIRRERCDNQVLTES